MNDVERLLKISKEIYRVASNNTKGATCEHGNACRYPSSGWWCDDCFQELDDAIFGLEYELEKKDE